MQTIHVILKNEDVLSAHFNLEAADIAMKSLDYNRKIIFEEDLDDETTDAIKSLDNAMLNDNLSREDIMDLAECGYKIAHKSFSSDEYVFYDGKVYRDEAGYNMGNKFGEFWTIRSGGDWENDWRIYRG